MNMKLKSDLDALQAENDWLRKQLGVQPFPCPTCEEMKDKLTDLTIAYQELTEEFDELVAKYKPKP